MTRKKESDAVVNMTPMIDVVFQLIIFFIVTMKITEASNPDIVLGKAPHGEQLKPALRPLVVEIDRRGWLSIQGAQLTESSLKTIIKRRREKYGLFPLMIRSDHRVRHQHVKKVLDLCSLYGLRDISFIAVRHAVPE